MLSYDKFGQEIEWAARIIQDSGGKMTGSTRLQKAACLLELVGLGDGFEFEYHRFGPFSQQLADAVSSATACGVISEIEISTDWGGTYSVFSLEKSGQSSACAARIELLRQACTSDPITLELAATAAFLAHKGESDPWTETERRKPAKANIRLHDAKELYLRLKTISTPESLPEIMDISESHQVQGDAVAGSGVGWLVESKKRIGK